MSDGVGESCLSIDLNAYWTMVRSHDDRVDRRVFNMWRYTFACQPVVNTPANVSCPGIRPVRPPRVGVGFFWIGCAERVNKSGVQERLKSSTFFGSKAMFSDVCLGVRQVNFLVCDIEVAAK